MPSPRFKIKQSADGQFVVALYAANNECLCVTETYTTLQSAERAIDAIRNAAQRADIVYDPEKKKPQQPPSESEQLSSTSEPEPKTVAQEPTTEQLTPPIEPSTQPSTVNEQQFEPEQLPPNSAPTPIADPSVPSDPAADPTGVSSPNPFSDLPQQ